MQSWCSSKKTIAGSCFEEWRWSNATAIWKEEEERDPHQKGVLELSASLKPRHHIPKMKKKSRSRPTIQSIIASIVAKEVCQAKMPLSPRSHKTAQATDVELAKALGLSSSQVAAISKQSSPRMRAKSIATDILKSRPLTTCAISPRFKAQGRLKLNHQPRMGF